MGWKSVLGLRRKIWIAVSLVTVIPIIILFYYFSGYYISAPTTAIAGLLIFLGWWIIFEVFWSIIKVAQYTRKTFEKLGAQVPPITNEVKSLESIMESLSNKVKKNLEQLKIFSEKTVALNKEVSKKVLILSTILQANDLVVKELANEKIVDFLIRNLKEILEMDICFCCLKEETALEFRTVSCLGTAPADVQGAIDRDKKYLGKIKKMIKIDKESRVLAVQSLISSLGIKSIAIAPLISRDGLMGIIGVGSRAEEFVFDKDCADVLSLFANNIVLVGKHKELSVKVKELEISDYLTGLYNEKFMLKRLDEEIKRSVLYQRPCGFILMEIANYYQYYDECGLIETETLLREVAEVYKNTVRPIDFIGRLGDSKIAVILIEKNKRQSHQVVKEIKKKIADKMGRKVTVAFAIAENPINGASAKELVNFAQLQIDKELKGHGVQS